MTPDKDMGQCVREDGRVVQYDRRQRKLIDADGVRAKFGVSPESIPDFLALVGDSADGYPGIPGWGKVSAGAVLTRYGHLEDIPERVAHWDVSRPRRRHARGVAARPPRRGVPVPRAGDAGHGRAAVPSRSTTCAGRAPIAPSSTAMAERLGPPELVDRVHLWADRRRRYVSQALAG